MRKPRDEKFITIKDVALKAGVSIATVSRVMNNGRVSALKKKNVLIAIKELNYVPNNSARNLASVNTTKRIKLIVPTIAMPCYIELIMGFQKGAQLYRYDPVIEEYEFDVLKYDQINMDSFASSEVKGIVQIGHYQEIVNKLVVSLDDDLLSIQTSDIYLNKNIGIYFPGDEFLTSYFEKTVFKGTKTFDASEEPTKEADIYITQTVEQAAKLMNDGILKPIYVLDRIKEVEKLISNIHSFPIDFYAIGLALSRIVIKKITGTLKEDDHTLIIAVD
ncbi:MAG: LacI family DNA-binding transcriptional regulator [Mycoplasmatales bacterium]